MRSEWRSFPLATITFLVERADITGPEPGVPVAEQTRERNQRVDDRSGHARNVTYRAGLLILSRAVALYTSGFGTLTAVHRYVMPGERRRVGFRRLACETNLFVSSDIRRLSRRSRTFTW